jgi:hypothetical protein
MEMKPVLHCFEGGPWVGDYEDGCGSTCMLPDGHDGPHEFTPDDQIVIRLAHPNKDEAGR